MDQSGPNELEGVEAHLPPSRSTRINCSAAQRVSSFWIGLQEAKTFPVWGDTSDKDKRRCHMIIGFSMHPL